MKFVIEMAFIQYYQGASPFENPEKSLKLSLFFSYCPLKTGLLDNNFLIIIK